MPTATTVPFRSKWVNEKWCLHHIWNEKCTARGYTQADAWSVTASGHQVCVWYTHNHCFVNEILTGGRPTLCLVQQMVCVRKLFACFLFAPRMTPPPLLFLSETICCCFFFQLRVWTVIPLKHKEPSELSRNEGRRRRSLSEDTTTTPPPTSLSVAGSIMNLSLFGKH